MPELRIFGVRHHGPGSARSLVRSLRAFAPDVLLIESPVEAESTFAMAGAEGLRPPVAILVYAADDPTQAAFYPFAEFSPEWNALLYANEQGIPVRAIDLPASASMQDPQEEDEEQAEEQEERIDPLGMVAEAAGFSDGESWWEYAFEQRWSPEDPFADVAALMAELRQHVGERREVREAQREAHMRLAIREASKSHERIAVVCGAWHVPALAPLVDGKGVPSASADRELLRGLPKRKINATWVPWTYERLAFASGYPAGVISPAYYEHIWKSEPDEIARGWLVRAAHLLREEDLPASTASVIEAVRLADTLACVRGRPVPGMIELLDSALAVLTNGDTTPLELIRRRLIVGEKLGEIPEDTPAIPLQSDIATHQRRLRLKPEASERILDLDLRNENDLERSYLLHRLSLLNIQWGVPEQVSGKLGTFHELWRLQWQPELAIAVILASRWGASVESAATARAINLSDEADSLGKLTSLAKAALTAKLSQALPSILGRVADQAAATHSAGELLDAVPSLAWIVRYGDVRGTEVSMVRQVLDSIFVRGCIALPQACASLDDEAAEAIRARLDETQSAVGLLQDEEMRALWSETLRQVVNLNGLHGLVEGGGSRLLFDGGDMDAEELGMRLSRASSYGAVPMHTAAWIEGLLGTSGSLLIHEDRLWSILDEWLAGLTAEQFIETLPLLRRTFSRFSAPERRQLGERAAGGAGPREVSSDLDQERAARPLPLLRAILGIPEEVAF